MKRNQNFDYGLIVEVGEQDKRIFRIGWSELNKRS